MFRNCDSVRLNAFDEALDELMSFCTCPGPLTLLLGGISSSRSAPYPSLRLPAEVPAFALTARNPESTSREPTGMNVVVSENSGVVWPGIAMLW